MNYLEALEAMANGHRVKLPEKDIHLWIEGNKMYEGSNSRRHEVPEVYPDFMKRTDWEVVE